MGLTAALPSVVHRRTDGAARASRPRDEATSRHLGVDADRTTARRTRADDTMMHARPNGRTGVSLADDQRASEGGGRATRARLAATALSACACGWARAAPPLPGGSADTAARAQSGARGRPARAHHQHARRSPRSAPSRAR
eukprot:scaffold5766_cov350-Prasinococcus_capsulatus_cf.AAC.3